MKEEYAAMQKRTYEQDASHWSLTFREPVVGSFDEHNNWKDYDDYLFKDIQTKDKVALDFGCGPGRNIVKYNDWFKRIDGVDISATNIKNAKIWAEHNLGKYEGNLYVCNGLDISDVPSNTYDVVFSTICLQHICVHEIRYGLLKEFLRVLKPGGSIAIQMGFGPQHIRRSIGYFESFTGAAGSNGFCDTRIDNTDEIKGDLEKIGFKDFSCDIRPCGPGDGHPNWIFFRATK